MADYDIGHPAQVSTVGPHGETLGPFVADEDGLAHVPDDMKNAIRALDRTGVPRHKAKTTRKSKES